ncbi:hypothetical protein A2U01_0006646, partial [Trifolium medium]|nr:hypothetical protein [Trifolium medium]
MLSILSCLGFTSANKCISSAAASDSVGDKASAQHLRMCRVGEKSMRLVQNLNDRRAHVNILLMVKVEGVHVNPLVQVWLHHRGHVLREMVHE